MTALYELEDVGRRFSRGSTEVVALSEVSLVIDQGDFVSIEGPSGSGKSTLLQLLGALDTPTEGTISFAGTELGSASDRQLTALRSSEIGFVFQQFNLIPTVTASENVELAMIPHAVSRADRRAKAVSLLESVGLGHRVEHLPSRMSGGEQQRVAIARALANSPKVLVADEPTGNLDSESAGDVMDVLDHLIDTAGVTVVVATHDPEVASHARRRLRLRDGILFDDAGAGDGDLADVLTTAVVLADRTGRIRYWSPGATELFGHPVVRALGQTLDLIVPPELRERHWAGFHRAWEQGLEDQLRIASIPVLCADGNVRRFPGRFEPVRGPHGELAALMAVLTAPSEGDESLFQLG